MRAPSLLKALALATAIADATPNIVFILTDDQDVRLGSLNYMPNLQQYVTSQGTQYTNHYCTTALCCPARVSIWTGKLAHNHNVTSIEPPYGGYPVFVQNGWNDNYLPVWLQNAGVNVYYAGKLFNALDNTNYNTPYPRGFAGTHKAFLLSPWVYQYFNPGIQQNQSPPVTYPGKYSNDVVGNFSLAMIDQAVAAKKPFVVVYAPVGIHSAGNPGGSNADPGMYPPVPATEDAHLFPNATVPRTPNFNPKVPSGENWIKKMPRMSDAQVAYNDEYYRARLRTLQSIDRIVGKLVQKLDSHGILNNTYVIFSSDNGYHIGQHRLPPGKVCGYDEDINVPLVIRGPGVPKGQKFSLSTRHTDLAPTILQMLNLPLNHQLDGAAIPLTTADQANAIASRERSEHVGVEFWGGPSEDGKYRYPFWKSVINTYKSVRVVAEDYGFYYQVWCSGERELYDMSADPYQMNNMINSTATLLGRPMPQILNRLDALLFVLKSCVGVQCRKPWQTMMPKTPVHNLMDALDSAYDSFFQAQVKVHFTSCSFGYIVKDEGPQWNTSGHVYPGSLGDMASLASGIGPAMHPRCDAGD